MAKRDAGPDPMRSPIWDTLTADQKCDHLRLEVAVCHMFINILLRALNIRFTDLDGDGEETGRD